MTQRILGLDPGATTGGYALLVGITVEAAGDIPSADGDVDAGALARLIANLDPHTAVVEQVASMPKQGVSSTFKFGRAYGTLLGVLGALAVPYQMVPPTRWKKAYRLPSKVEAPDAGRALAVQLHPEAAGLLARKKDGGRADAILIARWLAMSGRPLV
jgi:crossover junction endodeoxyribonuclease RuvC